MNSAKIYTLFLLSLIIICNCFGQSKRSAHWFFGFGAGLHFQNGVPLADTAGHMYTIESSASISDTTGNLLFYTNGESAWNKNHVIMPNGSNLFSNQSSNQGAIIAPLPNSNNLYYLFTTGYSFDPNPDTPAIRFLYSIVDMNLDNGLGDITDSKNIQLLDSTTEELAGTRHCNGTDYWIITRRAITDTLAFYAYQLTQDGLMPPVITKIPAVNPNPNWIGCTTFSQDGKLFVLSSFGTDTYIFDFNTQTGTLTFKDKIDKQNEGINDVIYSNAISPDNTKLYLDRWVYFTWNYLYQYDLTSPNIASTRILIDSVDFAHTVITNAYGLLGSMRLGSDQKIYVSTYNLHTTTPQLYDTLGVINLPNSAGLACNYQSEGVYLNNKGTQYSLPNFISNFTADDPISDPCPILPVKLLDFTYEIKEKNVKLIWETESELINDYFFIERSTDGQKYYSIGKVKGHLNSNTLQEYIFYDDNPFALNYYRLKQVDIDGNFTFSKTLLVKIPAAGNIVLLQNPVLNNLKVQLELEDGLHSVLKLCDISGRVLKVFQVKSGVNNFDVSSLSKGMYLLQLYTNDREVSNSKVIKL